MAVMETTPLLYAVNADAVMRKGERSACRPNLLHLFVTTHTVSQTEDSGAGIHTPEALIFRGYMSKPSNLSDRSSSSFLGSHQLVALLRAF